MVGVAQLVEHLVVVQVVAGSSPVTHPKARAICVRGGREPGRLRHFVRLRFARRGRGLRHPHPLRLRFARLRWLGLAFGFRLGLGLSVGFGAPADGRMARVKSSGSLWLGYGVVLVVTFGVGFLAFVVWVLSKVF
jgi:hypothetical protein